MIRLLPISLLLAAAVTTAPASAAGARPGDCAALSRQLQDQASAFVKVNADGRLPAQASNATPADFQRSLSQRDAALHAIANDVWNLRAELASRNCSQAESFAY